MQCVLAGLTMDQCLVYLDDIVVFAPTFNEHLKGISEAVGCRPEGESKRQFVRKFATSDIL